MNRYLSMVVFCATVVIISLGGGIAVDDSSYEDFIHLERGRGLMSLLSIPEADPSVAYSSWSFPTSIVVNGVSCRIRQTSQGGGFQIFSPTNSAVILARGGICRTSNARIARVCGFGEIALNSLPLRDFAQQVRVRPLDGGTNVLYLANVRHPAERLEVLIAKNYFLYMRGMSNNLELALSFFYSGLPFDDRVSFPFTQHQQR